MDELKMHTPNRADDNLEKSACPRQKRKRWGCGRFLGPELSNSKTASILHRTQTP